MKCPDCGSRLSDIQLDGKFLYRCFRCGGFWSDAHTFSEINPHTMVALRRVKIDSLWLKGGTGVCPQDNMILQKYVGEDVSPTIEVRYCGRCGKRWYGGDSLFVQKIGDGSVDARPASAPRVLFLSFAAVLLAFEFWASLKLVGQPQRTRVGAQSGIALVTIAPVDKNWVIVTVVSYQSIEQVEYRVKGQKDWQILPVVHSGPDTYVGKLFNLVPGVYEVRAKDQIKEFTI